jgi:hypothetical protein
MDGYDPDNPFTYRSGGKMQKYVAEDGEYVVSFASFSEEDAYDAFVDEFGHAPLRILDVTEAVFTQHNDETMSYTNAKVVWDSAKGGPFAF